MDAGGNRQIDRQGFARHQRKTWRENQRGSRPKSELIALKAYARGSAQTVPAWCAIIEYAETFHVAPQDVTRETKARWWYRWQAWTQAKNTREAYALAKQYKDVPQELRDVMKWADDSPQYVLNTETGTFEAMR